MIILQLVLTFFPLVYDAELQDDLEDRVTPSSGKLSGVSSFEFVLTASNRLSSDFEKFKFPTRSLSNPPPETVPHVSPRRSQPHPPEDLEPMPFEPAGERCLVVSLVPQVIFN